MSKTGGFVMQMYARFSRKETHPGMAANRRSLSESTASRVASIDLSPKDTGLALRIGLRQRASWLHHRIVPPLRQIVEQQPA